MLIQSELFGRQGGFMKHLLFSIFFLLICVGTYAQNKDEREILAVMDIQKKAWNKGDLETFMQTYWKSDSLLFVGSKGPVYGWQNTMDRYLKTYPDTASMGKLRFDILQLKRLSPEYYFVLGRWHLTRSIGNMQGSFTLIFRKIGEQWLIVTDHSS